MKYEVGDKVKVKDVIPRDCDSYYVDAMEKLAGCIVTISKNKEGWYRLLEDNYDLAWSEDIFEDSDNSENLDKVIKEVLGESNNGVYDPTDLPSSGQIETFDTGSMRDQAENKGRFDLIPFGPLARLALHYERGAKKYDDRNWEKGQPVSRFYDAAMRHLGKYLDGYDDEDHLSAVLWNIMGIMFMEENLPEMQDLPKRKGLPNTWKYKNTNL